MVINSLRQGLKLPQSCRVLYKLFCIVRSSTACIFLINSLLVLSPKAFAIVFVGPPIACLAPHPVLQLSSRRYANLVMRW